MRYVPGFSLHVPIIRTPAILSRRQARLTRQREAQAATKTHLHLPHPTWRGKCASFLQDVLRARHGVLAFSRPPASRNCFSDALSRLLIYFRGLARSLPCIAGCVASCAQESRVCRTGLQLLVFWVGVTCSIGRQGSGARPGSAEHTHLWCCLSTPATQCDFSRNV